VDYKSLRRRCAAQVRDLDIPTPFEVTELCRRLAAKRGRPLSLLPMSLLPGGPCGIWVATATADYIFYEERTSALHQEHIVLHEVGHMLCAHEAAPVLGGAATELLLPNLDPGMVQRVLGRTHYSAVEEREAELIATIILGRASHRTAEPRHPAPTGAAGIVARIERSLDPPGQA
jgi:hypothetical protein